MESYDIAAKNKLKKDNLMFNALYFPFYKNIVTPQPTIFIPLLKNRLRGQQNLS